VIDADPTGDRRLVVRVIPTTRAAGRASLDLSTVMPPH
jgi:hypothetical protein